MHMQSEIVEGCPEEQRSFPAPSRERIVTSDWKILVIEDDHLIRDLVVEWLTEAGYGVLSGAEADPITTVGPRLIIADPSTPKRDGRVLMGALRSTYPATPILLMSGWFRAGLYGCCEAARALGVRGVLSIPFSREQLLRAVSQAMEIAT